jgi:hypothetical protein
MIWSQGAKRLQAIDRNRRPLPSGGSPTIRATALGWFGAPLIRSEPLEERMLRYGGEKARVRQQRSRESSNRHTRIIGRHLSQLKASVLWLSQKDRTLFFTCLLQAQACTASESGQTEKTQNTNDRL